MQVNDIHVIGVVGAGQMGRGIAQVAAGAGFRTLLTDVSLAQAEEGKAKIAAALSRLVTKGKLEAVAREELLARIECSAGSTRLEEADFVVEAATEKVELKLQILREVDARLPAHAILASNTSSISLSRLAGAVARPTRVVGMHFMNPVPLMNLVEIVRALQTSEETFRTTRALAEALGKTVITSLDRPAFVVNRMLVPFLNEACFALQEGLASAEDIDQGARLGLNHPMGPLELADFIGLDTLLAIGEVLHRDVGDDKYRPPVLLRNLVAAGWLGKKSGRGFYVYDAQGQKMTGAGA
jgi:3-hydroxybutyryl-CoA dehydrogenase